MRNNVFEHFIIVLYLQANTTIQDLKSGVLDRNQPVIIITGDLMSPQKILVMAEGEVVVQVESVMQGLWSLFSLYYIMNFQYCPHVSKPLQFVQTQLLRSKQSQIYDSVTELSIKLGV